MTGDHTQRLAQRLIEISNEHSLEMTDDARHSLESAAEQLLFLKQRVAMTDTVCDAVYLERNQVVAALAKCFPSGIARTAIEGWAPEWHGCVYIDLPTGQASWHYHDREAHLFEGLPPYAGQWDGHDTPEKYRRLAALWRLERDPWNYATEINRLRNVIQAACLGGTDLMIERWKQLFPDAPVPTVKATLLAVPEASDLLATAVECGVIKMHQVMDTELQDALVAFAKRLSAHPKEAAR